MNVIYYKIWQDLWGQKTRTLQVILIIAMSAFAVGMVIASRNLTNSKISADWQATHPPTINLWVDPPIDENQLLALKNIEGVAEVEGLLNKSLEWRPHPTAPWQPATLMARDDYSEQKLGVIPLAAGNWPARSRLGVIKGADSYFNVSLGDQVELRVSPRERAKTFAVGGYLDSRYNQPLPLGGEIVFFTTRERFGEIVGSDNFSLIIARGPFYTPAYATETANRIDRHFEKFDIETGGAGPEGRRTSDPNRHFIQEILDGINLLLGIISLAITGLGLFLIYNTVHAIVTQQINQIGVMKAVGAGWGQILWIYAIIIFFYGVVAALIAIPTGAVAGWLFASLIMGVMSIEAGPLTFDMAAVWVQIWVALLSPILASTIPLFNGIRLTVREAMGSYGLTGAAGLTERLLARTENLPYTLVLVIGNTFRNLNRVWLTQITLAGSGMIFIMVMGVSDSTTYTLSQAVTNVHRYDVTFTFENPERIERIKRMALAQAGVKAVELWNVAEAKIRPEGQPEMQEDDQVTTLFGLPLPVELYQPQVVAGRWLEPGDTYAVVLNERLAAKIGVDIGDSVTFYHTRKKESTWKIVGLASDPLTLYSAYLPQPYLALETGSVNQANTVWIQGLTPDPESAAGLAQQLRQFFKGQNILLEGETTFQKETIAGITEENRVGNEIIVTMLVVMAVVIALVGSIGLSGMLSLSVLERQREIGVMRALGASSARVATIFIGEGLLMGFISWLIAAPTGVPIGYWLTSLLGEALNQNLTYHFSSLGLWLWLVIIIVLSIAASWLPARRATQIRVRESLAYL